MKTKSNIHISGRRWFQKTYGNTYHSVTIYKDGAQATYCPMQYGYGDQFLQTAWAKLQELGIIPKDAPYGGTLALRETYGISYDVTDVARKRDL